MTALLSRALERVQNLGRGRERIEPQSQLDRRERVSPMHSAHGEATVRASAAHIGLQIQQLIRISSKLPGHTVIWYGAKINFF